MNPLVELVFFLVNTEMAIDVSRWPGCNGNKPGGNQARCRCDHEKSHDAAVLELPLFITAANFKEFCVQATGIVNMIPQPRVFVLSRPPALNCGLKW